MTIKVTVDVVPQPKAAEPPIKFPFLYGSPRHPDRIYLRFMPALGGNNTDLKLTGSNHDVIPILELTNSGITDQDAWANRLSSTCVVSLRNDF